MKKKFLMIFIIVLILMNSFVVVRAQESEGPIEGLLSMIHNLFGFLPKYLTLENLMGSGEEHLIAVFLAKFVLWILMYSLLHYGASHIFTGATRGVRVAVPFILAILFVVAIPSNVLLQIFKTYTVVGSLCVWLIPIGGIIYFNYRFLDGSQRWHYIVRAILFILLIWFFREVSNALPYITGETPPPRGQYVSPSPWIRYMDFLLFYAVFGFFHSLWKFITFGGGIGIGLRRGGKGAKGLSPEDYEKKLVAMREEEEEERKVEKELIKEEDIDIYIRKAQSIEETLDTNKKLLDQKLINLEEYKKRLLDALENNTAVFEELNSQLSTLEGKIARGEVQNPDAVRAKIEELREAINKSYQRQHELLEGLYSLLQQEEQVIEEEEKEEEKEKTAEQREEQAEKIEEREEAAEAAEESKVQKEATKAGEKETVKAAKKVKKVTEKREHETKAEERTTKKKIGAERKAIKKEKKEELTVQQQMRLIKRIAELTNSMVNFNLPDKLREDIRKDLNACFKKLGKSEKRIFTKEKEIIRLHKKIQDLEVKEENIESVKKGLIQKAHNAIREEEQVTARGQ